MLIFEVSLSDAQEQKYNSGNETAVQEVELAVKSTQVASFYIGQYFNPNIYNEQGANSYISRLYF